MKAEVVPVHVLLICMHDCVCYIVVELQNPRRIEANGLRCRGGMRHVEACMCLIALKLSPYSYAYLLVPFSATCVGPVT